MPHAIEVAQASMDGKPWTTLGLAGWVWWWCALAQLGLPKWGLLVAFWMIDMQRSAQWIRVWAERQVQLQMGQECSLSLWLLSPLGCLRGVVILKAGDA